MFHDLGLYFARLVKASLLVALAPIMVLVIFVIYGKISLLDMAYGGLAAFGIAMLFVRPYLADLSSLTFYVEQLALDKRAKAPSLSFLSNVEKLSAAVNQLNKSWEEKKLQLESMLVESKIIFDTLPDILIMLDEDCRIVRTNSAAHNLFRRHLVHKPLKEIIADPILHNGIKRVLAEKRGKDVELHLGDPLNKHFIVRIERFPVHSPGGIAFIIVMHDITESKRTEQMFADFVANASHEIRTPLASLIGFIETLRTTAKDDPAAQEKFLGIMTEQGERMSRLVRDLLSLSKIEMNAHTIPTEIVNIGLILRMVQNQTEWFAKERSVVIDMALPEDLPPVMGDSNELGQVFHNLIENAVKYGNGNSTVRVKAETVHKIPKELVNLKNNKQIIAISVEDSGEGIEKEHIPRLTERFYRVDSARSRKNKIGGTGLGLAIVKHILRRHQADMVIESTVGVGSIFTVYLPAIEQD